MSFLDDIRAIAVCMVVAVHATGYSHWRNETLFFIIKSIAVPIFFLVDGFIFAFKQDGRHPFDYRQYLLKSAKRLLIPWIMFDVIYLVLRFIAEHLHLLPAKMFESYSFIGFILWIYTAPHAMHLYFLPSLFMIRCLSIVTCRLADLSRPFSVLAFAAYGALYSLYGHFLLSPLQGLNSMGGLDPFGHALWGLQYYLFGIVLFRYWKQLSNHALSLSIVLLGFICAVRLMGSGVDPTVTQYSYLAGLFFIVMYLSKKRNVISYLGTYTMGIYLVHNPILLNVSFRSFRYLVSDERLIYWLSLLIVVAASFAITSVIQRYTPYGKILFGMEASAR